MYKDKEYQRTQPTGLTANESMPPWTHICSVFIAMEPERTMTPMYSGGIHDHHQSKRSGTGRTASSLVFAAHRINRGIRISINHATQKNLVRRSWAGNASPQNRTSWPGWTFWGEQQRAAGRTDAASRLWSIMGGEASELSILDGIMMVKILSTTTNVRFRRRHGRTSDAPSQVPLSFGLARPCNVPTPLDEAPGTLDPSS